MRVGVAFDTDTNPGTGAAAQRGAEVLFQFDVAGNSAFFFRWNGSILESRFSNTGRIVNTSTSVTFTINRSELSATSRLNFSIYADRFNGSDFVGDVAPNAGSTWAYDVLVTPTTTTTPTTGGADPDGDGVAGADDACPRVRGGAYDRNGNGCPGPYSAIHVPTSAELRPSATSGGVTTYARPRNTIHRLPAGAHVLLRYGSQRESLQAGSSGTVASALLLRNRFHNGSAIEIRAWKAGWIGFAVRLVVRTTEPLALVTAHRCISATDTRPRPCSEVSHGR
jgi:hypothetical protein